MNFPGDIKKCPFRGKSCICIHHKKYSECHREEILNHNAKIINKNDLCIANILGLNTNLPKKITKIDEKICPTYIDKMPFTLLKKYGVVLMMSEDDEVVKAVKKRLVKNKI